MTAVGGLFYPFKERTAESMKPLRIAIAKGRICGKVADLLEKSNVDCSAVREPGRRLILPLGPWEAVLAKSPDVLTYVERGACELGIVGKDTILEHTGAFYELLDLKIAVCRFAVAAPVGVGLDGIQRIATKYPGIARSFFTARGMDVEIIELSGSVELAPLLGLADAIVDLVETGKTLIENGLAPIHDIAPISTRLVANISSMKLRRAEMLEFVSALEKGLLSVAEEKEATR